MSLSRKLAVVMGFVLTASLAVAQGPSPHAQGVQNLINDTLGEALISVDDQTGLARFVQMPTKGKAPLARGPIAPAGDRAMNFFRAYGSAFGVTAADDELQAVRMVRDGYGNEHAIFKQNYMGIPVFGGELRAHFNNQGELYAANGNFVPVSKLDMTPSLSQEEAEGRAIRDVTLMQFKRARGGLEVGDEPVGPDESFESLSVAATTLMVFRTGLVQGVPGRDYLAYEVEVVNDGPTVREFVYVDAHGGKVLDRITGIHDALFRRAYDAEGFPHPGPNYDGFPFWVEGDPFPTGNVEADNMIYASEETYDLFDNAFGRDSFDAAGATMDAIFNRGDSCPNASWNGIYISFCPGLTTDDVTAHEWGHAYTDFTNNLIYQWQSGALNESYSDIWGETVDLINGRQTDLPGGPRTDGACAVHTGGTDNSLRWLMGEDVNAPGLVGAIRDMWTPTCYGDPGKVTDTQYHCGPVGSDFGGVHINSGIPNHAFSLMVDGGTFNGYSGAGLGLTKAAHIEWAAQIMLTPASNFLDNADALEAACSSLIGANLLDLSTGLPSGMMIDAADCSQVSDIVDAVEFRTPPTQCGFTALLDPDAPALCEGFGTAQTTSFENFESGSLPAGWTVGHDAVVPADFDTPDWAVVTGLPAGANGTYAAFVEDIIDAGDNCASENAAGALFLDSPAIVLPVGEVPHVAFDHWVATEFEYDGGNVKVSANGGPWTPVPGSAYSFNAYNATLLGSPLGGEDAFTGSDGGSTGGSWGQSQVNLFGLAFPGDTVRLRFDFGVDECNGLVGWYVDDVHVYTCSDEPLPICGDGLLNHPDEVCDDGNMADGDGCSSTCEVEDGWICADPVPSNPDGSNVVADESFEGGVPNADWTAFSTFGGFAEFPLCGPGNGCPATSLARTGSWLVWVGGLSTGVTSSVDQDITIPAAATDLKLYTWRGICDDPSDTLHVSLDGTDIGTVVCDGVDGGWVEQTFPVAPFNDGGSHTLFIGGTVGGTNGTHSNFFVEDVVLNDNTPTPATPSVCLPLADDLACNAVVGWDNGIAGGWTVVDNEGTGVVWTDIASSGLGGNYTGGAGEAASVSSDAFIFTEFDTELISNSFSLDNASSANLDYLVNYQNLDFLDFLDLDISTDGGGSWTNLLSWNEDHPPGGLFAAPGEAPSIDLAAYVGEPDVQVRWHYYDPNFGDWDWYAQVDNVALSCELTPPQTLKEEAVVLLEDIEDGNWLIWLAVRDIERSLRSQYWVDDSHLNPKKGRRVFNFERSAAWKLKYLLHGSSLSPEDAAIVSRVIDKLVLADDQLAQIGVDEATAAVDSAGCESDDAYGHGDCRCGKAQWELAKAEYWLARARAHAEAGNYVWAISEYKWAWHHAQRAIAALSAKCRGKKRGRSDDIGPAPAPSPVTTPPPNPAPAPTPEPIAAVDPAPAEIPPAPAEEPVVVEPAVEEAASPPATEPIAADAGFEETASLPPAEPTEVKPPIAEEPAPDLRVEEVAETAIAELEAPAELGPQMLDSRPSSVRSVGVPYVGSSSDRESSEDRATARVRGLTFQLTADRSILVGGFSVVGANVTAGDIELSVSYRQRGELEWMAAGAACSAEVETLDDGSSASDGVAFTCELAEQVPEEFEVKVELGLPNGDFERTVHAASAG